MGQERRDNNFDFLRLFAAIGVIFSHSYMLLDKDASEPLARLTGNWPLSEIGVYIFFIISGYLIARSYHSHPKLYWRNRLLRIMPALGLNLLITAFIIGAVFTDLSTGEYFSSVGTYRYLENIITIIFCWSLPGVFKDNHSLMVNGSLWTLGYEMIMYMFIWCIGVAGIGFKKAVPLLAAGFLLLLWQGIDYYGFNGAGFQLTIVPSSKLGLLFMIGSGFYIFRDRIRFNLVILTILAVASVVALELGFAAFTAFVFLPYAVLYFAFSQRIKLHRTARYGDFSYGMYIYAYPVQQSLLAAFGELSPLVLFAYALPITAGLAVLSWHVVEKRALRLKTHKSESHE